MSYDEWPPNYAEYDLAEPVEWRSPPPWALRPSGKPLHMLTLEDPEVWMPLESYLGLYEVSSHGRVRSFPRSVAYDRIDGHSVRRRHVRGGILLIDRKTSTLRYAKVSLCAHPKPARQVYVHVLVAESFLGDPPTSKMVIRHLDDDGWHNAPANLRFGTCRENYFDALRNGRTQRNSVGDDLPKEHVAAIKALMGRVSSRKLGSVFKRSSSRIRAIHQGKSYEEIAACTLAHAIALYHELERRRNAA